MGKTAESRLALALSVLGGFVDAIGYLSVGGFVSFMSGNSTLLGIGVVQELHEHVEVIIGLVTSFVVGVVAGSLAGRVAGRWFLRQPAVLLLVAAGLAGSAWLDRRGLRLETGFAMAAAMGAVNTVFQRTGKPGLGLTYMTGTLVRVGQWIAELLTGGPWKALAYDLVLWAGMVVGALGGTLAFSVWGVGGVWGGAGASVLLAAVAWWFRAPADVQAAARAP